MERNIIITVLEKPERKLIIFPSTGASDYCAYCGELGCDVVDNNWRILQNIEGRLGEPCGYWIPDSMRGDDCAEYAHGVEVACDYDDGAVPTFARTILLPAQTVLEFKGEPYDDVDYESEIGIMSRAINAFAPGEIGYAWDNNAVRYQLEPIGERGYIEGRGVVKADNIDPPTCTAEEIAELESEADSVTDIEEQSSSVVEVADNGEERAESADDLGDNISTDIGEEPHVEIDIADVVDNAPEVTSDLPADSASLEGAEIDELDNVLIEENNGVDISDFYPSDTVTDERAEPIIEGGDMAEGESLGGIEGIEEESDKITADTTNATERIDNEEQDIDMETMPIDNDMENDEDIESEADSVEEIAEEEGDYTALYEEARNSLDRYGEGDTEDNEIDNRHSFSARDKNIDYLALLDSVIDTDYREVEIESEEDEE